jgi:hypothetical protein
LQRQTDMWTLDSPRIWYEPEPFRTEQGINGFRRFRISGLALHEEGLGIVSHVETGFFTVRTVGEFFDETLPADESEARLSLFNILSRRQAGHKGTLLYDLRRTRHKCYFVEFVPGVTCATTGVVPVDGTTYDSLHHYYQVKRPHAGVEQHEPVAKVSFPGLSRAVPVAASRLHLRVTGEALPRRLKHVDNIRPGERARLVEKFWGAAGDALLGKRLTPGLWRPPAAKVVTLKVPSLLFGDGETLLQSTANGTSGYINHFNARLPMLDRHRSYDVPPAVARSIVLAYPTDVSATIVQQFANGLTARLGRWTGKSVDCQTLAFPNIEQLIEGLSSRGAGLAVCVFDPSEPQTYYLLSASLKSWRIKRVTTDELVRRHGERSFLDMNALDVLELLGCVPWTIDAPLTYQAQLAIDVGANRRHFAVSLLVCRPRDLQPAFWLDTLGCWKPDSGRETIGRDILRDQIVKLYKGLLVPQMDPIESVLVLRDGRERGDEGRAIREAHAELTELGILSGKAEVDIVDFAKRSVKDVRFWHHADGNITNVLEGTGLVLDNKTVVLANTGRATLHQGTASPVALSATHEGIDMIGAANDVFATAQLNWASPRKAHRLPAPLRRTDRELENRVAQEIRGLQ